MRAAIVAWPTSCPSQAASATTSIVRALSEGKQSCSDCLQYCARGAGGKFTCVAMEYDVEEQTAACL